MQRLWGVEILEHTDEAVDLTRLREIGTVLFNHDRDRVIGHIVDASVTDGRGRAVIELDTDEFSETIRQKILSGSLRGVSVGYDVDVWEDVAANKRSSDNRFEGPCSIGKRWTPLEVSIVSVPADAAVGVGRTLEIKTDRRALNRRIYEYNNNLAGGLQT